MMKSSMDNAIFLDTSFFKALVDNQDDFSPRATEIWQKFKNLSIMLISSNLMLDESFTLIRVRCGLERVKTLKDFLATNSKTIQIHRVKEVDEKHAWEWFEKDWSKLSFTDCVTFAQMKRLGIKKVATFDEHFKRAGFEVVL